MQNHRFIHPQYLNTLGTLYGGQLLYWFDEEAALFAYECLEDSLPKRIVSVAVYSFNFAKPVFADQRIRSNWEVVHFGHSSFTVKGTYEKWEDNKWVEVAEGYSCICTTDEENKPIKFKFNSNIDVEKIKNNKNWKTIEILKKVTRL